MKCYNHPEKDGVAICKVCGKSICHACVMESTEGITCQQSCRNALAEKNAFNKQLTAHQRNLKRMNFLGSIFSMFMGILFIYFSQQGFGLVYDFIFLVGIGFTVYGIMALSVIMIIFLKSQEKQKSVK